jgi:hypothetical protein
MATLYHKALDDKERESVHSMWAPTLDLESPDINPDVHRCLFDYLGDFIAAWKARSVKLEDRVVENATAALYRSFDFNANMDWDPVPYHEQMTARCSFCALSFQLAKFPSRKPCTVISTVAALLFPDEGTRPIVRPPTTSVTRAALSTSHTSTRFGTRPSTFSLPPVLCRHILLPRPSLSLHTIWSSGERACAQSRDGRAGLV